MAVRKRATVGVGAADVMVGPRRQGQVIQVTSIDGAGVVAINPEGTATLAGDDMWWLPAVAGAVVYIPMVGDADGDGNVDVNMIASVATDVWVSLVNIETGL